MQFWWCQQTLGLLKIKVIWNKGYDIITSVHDVTDKILSRETLAFYERSYQNIDQKNQFFDGCSWFKFSNLELALDMALKVYTSVTKELKLKVRKIWELIPMFVEVTGEKLVGDELPPPFSIGLKKPRGWLDI